MLRAGSDHLGLLRLEVFARQAAVLRRDRVDGVRAIERVRILIDAQGAQGVEVGLALLGLLFF